MITLLYVLHVMVCVVLIAVVPLQRGKGADLGAALGGGGANTVFGGRGAGNFLTKLTTGSAIVFMCTSFSLAYIGTQQADVQLFGDGDLAAEETLAGAATNSDADDDASELEELQPEDLGGLEEIDPADLDDADETAP